MARKPEILFKKKTIKPEIQKQSRHSGKQSAYVADIRNSLSKWTLLKCYDLLVLGRVFFFSNGGYWGVERGYKVWLGAMGVMGPSSICYKMRNGNTRHQNRC